MHGISESGEQILLPAVLALIALWTAHSLGFFSLPPRNQHEGKPRIVLWQVVSVLAIYLGCALFVPLLTLQFLSHFFPSLGKPEFGAVSALTPLRAAYSQMVSLASSAFFLFLFCLLQKDRVSMRYLWKAPLIHRTSIRYDFGMGVLTWLISFPLVTVVGSLADLIIGLLFGPQEYEQVAVRYLKTSLNSQFLFVLAMITILVVAPIIEELLFRGFWQNFLKRYTGRKAAILLSAFTFALFHFSLSQDLGNVPLVASLFALALFLGFIYERQQSLFASIGLHMTFNTISVLRILLASGT